MTWSTVRTLTSGCATSQSANAASAADVIAFVLQPSQTWCIRIPIHPPPWLRAPMTELWIVASVVVVRTL